MLVMDKAETLTGPKINNTFVFVPNVTCRYQTGRGGFEQIFRKYVWVQNEVEVVCAKA